MVNKYLFSKLYPANSLYNIATGILRHFRDDLKRFDLNILAKDDANFSSFRNALDSRMKQITSPGIGTTKNAADPLTLTGEELLWLSFFIIAKYLAFGL